MSCRTEGAGNQSIHPYIALDHGCGSRHARHPLRSPRSLSASCPKTLRFKPPPLPTPRLSYKKSRRMLTNTDLQPDSWGVRDPKPPRSRSPPPRCHKLHSPARTSSGDRPLLPPVTRSGAKHTLTQRTLNGDPWTRNSRSRSTHHMLPTYRSVRPVTRAAVTQMLAYTAAPYGSTPLTASAVSRYVPAAVNSMATAVRASDTFVCVV